MSEEVEPQTPAAPKRPRRDDLLERARLFLRDYAWFIVRNVIGWVLILTSPVLGLTIPGPGGLPVFLIGFALVTFPGKRKLTARVLRGRRLRIEDRAYAVVAGFISIVIPGIALWVLAVQMKAKDELARIIELYAPKKSVWVFTILLAIVSVWAVTRISLKILNGLLRLLPKFRRRFRPWLRKKGLKLLPPRRRKSPEQPHPPDEILEIDPKHQRRFKALWSRWRPWIMRGVGFAITVWIVMIMIRPLRLHWHEVREQIAAISVWRFVGASAMFAVFLFVFRALSWRRALKGFGYKLPYGAAVRIWSTSELARYLPGAIWQVVGRVVLSRPYGVPGSIVSTSQILEVCIFLFANVLIAAACLLWFGQKVMQQSHARPWMITAMALVPALALLLHPKVFYSAANAILRRVGKNEIVKRLRGRKLVALLGWMMLGLVWQSAAVYIVVDPALHLIWHKWWVVAGAYCLAWIAGFLAFWAPGGIGVRELVFLWTMQAILPSVARQHFHDPVELKALLVFLGFLLRFWTVLGELMLTAVACAWDYRGLLNRPDAPGQVPPEENGINGEARESEPSPAVAGAASAYAGTDRRS